MEPQAVSIAAFVLVALEFEAELSWHLSRDTPLIIGRMGLIGQLLQQAAFFTVLGGGISILVWSFTQLPWYQPLLLVIAALVAVRALSRPIVLRAWLTSVLVPPVAAIGIVVLHWFTWFA